MSWGLVGFAGKGRVSHVLGFGGIRGEGKGVTCNGVCCDSLEKRR